MVARMVPGEVIAHAIHHQLAKIFSVGIPHADGSMQRGFNARSIKIVEDITVALMIRALGVMGIEYRIRQAARGAHERHGAVFESDELRQAARLEETWRY